MKDIVFIEPNHLKSVPFTTSDVIAEYAEVQHHTVTRLIQKHESDLKEFGILRFKIEEITGRGQPEKHYELNEAQATLLITFLKNTAPVRKFKIDLVREFYRMREELLKRHNWRGELKPIRKSLTQVIQENPNKGDWSYKIYTDLIYKYVIGKNAVQIRKERDLPNRANVRDYLNSDELQRVAVVENQISVLISMGFTYEEIKERLKKKSALLEQEHSVHGNIT